MGLAGLEERGQLLFEDRVPFEENESSSDG